MRYAILRPLEPTFDPRHVELKDYAHLHELLPPVAELETETEAVSCARRMYPGALAMPMPLKIGSGHTVALGFVEDPSEPFDQDDDIPFVLFVQPLPQSDLDRRSIWAAINKGKPLFDQRAWSLKPVRPELHRTMAIEWRTSELDAPAYLDARVGYEDGRLVIYAEMGEHSMSIMLPKGLVLSDPAKEENDHAADRADRASY